MRAVDRDSRGPRGALVAACAVGSALIAQASVADAQLHDEAQRVAQAWQAAGARTLLLETRFLNGERTDVALPAQPQAPCSTLAFLGARGLSFRVGLVDADGEDASDTRISSEAGAVSAERCGQLSWLRAVIQMESGRGALEIVVAQSAAPLTALRNILPERTEGNIGPEPEPGRLAPLPSPEKRATLEEARAKRNGAEIGRRMIWMAGPEGRGNAETVLDAGCHTLVLFAPESGSSSQGRDRLDLDAEMRAVIDDHLMARDQTDAPDARIAACVGEATRVSAQTSSELRPMRGSSSRTTCGIFRNGAADAVGQRR